jgi:excisionase family DNA binding protein
MVHMFTNTPPKLLSVGEVATVLSVHPHTVYRKIHSGQLPATRLGEDGPLRVNAAALEDWLSRNTVNGDAA